MNKKTFDFTIIGGDMRQVWLAKLLASKGYCICHYHLCTPLKAPCVQPADSLLDAVSSSTVCIAPIPFSKILNKISFLEFSNLLSDGCTIFAGCIPDTFLELIRERNISVFDFMDSPEFSFWNAKATAEAVLANAIFLNPRTLFESRCLILGYGKCAKALARLLSMQTPHLSVSARNPVQLAEASLTGAQTFPLNQLSDCNLSSFDFIFNTIPAPILTSTLLEQISPLALLLDLASAPGGFNLEEAKSMGKNAYLLLGLPGKYAPLSSAEKMMSFIFQQNNLLSET